MNSLMRVTLRFSLVVAAISIVSQQDCSAQRNRGRGDRESIMAGYLTVPNEKVPESFGGGFSLYVNAWPLLEHYPGRKFQTGLFGTWMFPVYDPPVARPLKEGVYTDIEGGLGWWRDTRFATATPKFIMGGVALNFIEWANGPGAGKRRDWDQPRGKYAVIQLSPNLLWPPDGVNLKQGTSNKWFGYGYLPLPLTAPKTLAGNASYPTGNQCWTLFLNTQNFKGPVAFFNPEFWTKHAANKAGIEGKLLDAAPANPNRALQMETQYIPSVQAEDMAGNRFARIAPTRFPNASSKNEENASQVVRQITSYRKSALWNEVESWFDGGKAASGVIDPDDQVVHSFTGRGGASWAIFIEGTGREDRIPIDWTSFAEPTKFGDHTFGYLWDMSSVNETDGNRELVVLPEYYRLSESGGRKRWVPISKDNVPVDTKLQSATFEPFQRPPTDPYVTPTSDDSVWKSPGPVAGPFDVTLGDGSQVTYCWYKFSDQPAMQKANFSDAERDELQRRVELMHRHWKSERDYLPPLQDGELAELDSAILVTPPKGFEIGYVPIVSRQGDPAMADQQ